MKQVEDAGEVRIKSSTQLFEDFGQQTEEQAEAYAQQLTSYMRTYTKGGLHARVTNTSSEDIVELIRDTVWNGRYRNKNRMVVLRGQAYQ